MKKFSLFVLAAALVACGEDKSGAGGGNTNACTGVICANGQTCVVNSAGLATCPVVDGGTATCTGTSCGPGRACSVENNVIVCAMASCSGFSCPSGQVCVVDNNAAVCRVPTGTCSGFSCPTGQSCVLENNAPVCRASGGTCSGVSCSAGQACELRNNLAVCIGTCTGVSCGAGQTCAVQNNVGVCVASGTCSGFSCPSGQSCVLENNAPVCRASTGSCTGTSCPSGFTCQLVNSQPICISTNCTDSRCLLEAQSVEITRASNNQGISSSTGWRLMCYRQEAGLGVDARRQFGSGDLLTYTFVREGFLRATDMRSNSFEERNMSSFANQTAASAGYRVVFRYNGASDWDVSDRVLICADPNSLGSSGQWKLEMWRRIGEQRCGGIL